MDRLASDRAAPWLALLAGAVLATGFEPLGLWPLTLASIAAFFALLHAAPSGKRAALLGFLFGTGQFIVGLNWIATSFTYQAAMPAWLGYLAVVLLSLFLASYVALAAFAAKLVARGNRVALVLALSATFLLGEYLRANLFSGFAWNPVGVGLIDTWLASLSRWIGTYGLGAVAIMVAGAAWLTVRRQFVSAAAIAAPLFLLAFLAAPPTPQSTGKPVRIVQPNIDQADKWQPGFDNIASQRLFDLSVQPGGERPRLLLWPEAAVVDPLLDEREGQSGKVRFEQIRAARPLEGDEWLVTGGLGVLSEDGRNVSGVTNSIFALAPGGGAVVARYDKAHLVPYGEYLPMRAILEPLGLSRLAPGSYDFDPGPGPANMELPGFGKIGLQICYEIIFSGEVVSREDRPAFIYNPSNDAWFGRWGPPQHLAQARLRALEEGLPVLRATPTGISAVITPDGRVTHRLGWREAGMIDADLPQAFAPTLFARFGNSIPLLLALLLLAGGIALARRAR